VQPKLDITVTHLEMLREPQTEPVAPPREGLLLMRAHRPSVAFYRFLYNTVGGPWLWHIRRRMSDAELADIVQDERVEVQVLYAQGVPAGYFELDCREAPDVELAYLGLVPEQIGQGLGKYLLDRAIRMAWQHRPRRFWLHTCTLDHPRALELYHRSGLVPCKSVQETIEDPRASGLF
jgi:GNAT superfamily N-acetyltransferase